ncbi:unnamed protein product [Arabidopsis halleri]
MFTEELRQSSFCIHHKLDVPPLVFSSGFTNILNVSPLEKLHDGPQPDLSTVIPNLAMKSTILSWCDRNKMEHPRPPDYAYVEGGVVRTRMDSIPLTGSESIATLRKSYTPVGARIQIRIRIQIMNL